ncbi:hypothetical protein PsYK624_149720 [Phanerochaete sordida]|uniref:Uncharacterized protein n=1 Tax=Phanerochaete sordida TaxID=48140 RepID=A0A9P3GNM9_9APHY|nr:hypothetical protein PsYK624_149720 [Phanerochaete sordida]
MGLVACELGSSGPIPYPVNVICHEIVDRPVVALTYLVRSKSTSVSCTSSYADLPQRFVRWAHGDMAQRAGDGSLEHFSNNTGSRSPRGH